MMEGGRRPTRLPRFDYGSPGTYFVTVCTHGRKCVLSHIFLGADHTPQGGDGAAPLRGDRLGESVGEGQLTHKFAQPNQGFGRSLICALPTVTLTEIGSAVEESVAYIGRAYPGVSVESCAIMPNHVHLLISIEERMGGDGAAPLQEIVGRMKSYTTHLYGGKLWQRSFYDHVIRSERDYLEIRRYIDENPAKWAEDRFYAP